MSYVIQSVYLTCLKGNKHSRFVPDNTLPKHCNLMEFLLWANALQYSNGSLESSFDSKIGFEVIIGQESLKNA